MMRVSTRVKVRVCIEDHRPLSLPCGHVFCKTCLQKCTHYETKSARSSETPEEAGDQVTPLDRFAPSPLDDTNLDSSTSNSIHSTKSEPKPLSYILCPSDKKKHFQTITNLPCCYQILQNIPVLKMIQEQAKKKGGSVDGREKIPDTPHVDHPTKKSDGSLCCIRHEKKKIKFICENHMAFLCSKCVIQHTGAGHLVKEFKITQTQMRNDFQDVCQKFQTLYSNQKDSLKKNEGAEKKLLDHYNTELGKLNSCCNSIVKQIEEKRKIYSDQLKKRFNEQKHQLKHQSNSSDLKKLTESIAGNCKELNQLGKNIGSMFYEEFYKEMITKSDQIKGIEDKKTKLESGDVSDVKFTKLVIFRDPQRKPDIGSIKELGTTPLDLLSKVGEPLPELNRRHSEKNNNKKLDFTQDSTECEVDFTASLPIGCNAARNRYSHASEEEEVAMPSVKHTEMQKQKRDHSKKSRKDHSHHRRYPMEDWTCKNCFAMNHSANSRCTNCKKASVRDKSTRRHARSKSPHTKESKKHGHRKPFKNGKDQGMTERQISKDKLAHEARLKYPMKKGNSSLLDNSNSSQECQQLQGSHSSSQLYNLEKRQFSHGITKKELEEKVGGSEMNPRSGLGKVQDDLRKHVSEFSIHDLNEKESVPQTCSNGSRTERKPGDGVRGFEDDEVGMSEVEFGSDGNSKLDSSEIGGRRKKYLNPNQMPEEFSDQKQDRHIQSSKPDYKTESKTDDLMGDSEIKPTDLSQIEEVGDQENIPAPGVEILDSVDFNPFLKNRISSQLESSIANFSNLSKNQVKAHHKRGDATKKLQGGKFNDTKKKAKTSSDKYSTNQGDSKAKIVNDDFIEEDQHHSVLEEIHENKRKDGSSKAVTNKVKSKTKGRKGDKKHKGKKHKREMSV